MKCPRCENEIKRFDKLLSVNGNDKCKTLSCEFYNRVINFVNPDDIKESFWKRDYLIQITRFGIPFIVNADCEQDAIDEIIDYIEAMKWDGLLLDYNDSDDLEMIESGDYICGGNHSRYLSTYHIRIESL